jgi:hypothetical protein
MVTIATFNDGAKARELKDQFQKSGIRADIHNEGHLQRVAFMSKPQANVKLQVEDDDFERAQNLMVEWQQSDPAIAGAMLRCPQCNSSSIEYPQMSRKSITPGMVTVLYALRILPKEFYCRDCQFTWSNEEETTIGRWWHRLFPGAQPDAAASAAETTKAP